MGKKAHRVPMTSMKLVLPVMLMLLTLVSACASPQAVTTEMPLATERGISLGAVTSKVAVTREQQGIVSREIDPAELMRQAIEKRLARSDLSQPRGEIDPYRLDVTIVDYQPGSAFARWLLPGLGATVLEVSGAVVDPVSGEPVGEVHDQRGVYAGGFYTIGAWQKIFDQVADDIVLSLERGGAAGPEPGVFGNVVVTVDSWLARDISIPKATEPKSFEVRPVVDLRDSRGVLGKRTAAFNVSMGNVFFYRDLPGFVAEMVATDLAAAGHTISIEGVASSSEADGATAIPVFIELRKFSVGTDTTALYWDIIAEIELAVRVGGAPLASASCREVERTYLWPETVLFNAAVDRCLISLMAKLRALPAWDAAPKLARAG